MMPRRMLTRIEADSNDLTLHFRVRVSVRSWVPILTLFSYRHVLRPTHALSAIVRNV